MLELEEVEFFRALDDWDLLRVFRGLEIFALAFAFGFAFALGFAFAFGFALGFAFAFGFAFALGFGFAFAGLARRAGFFAAFPRFLRS